jgi:hypothetical protein
MLCVPLLDSRHKTAFVYLNPSKPIGKPREAREAHSKSRTTKLSLIACFLMRLFKPLNLQTLHLFTNQIFWLLAVEYFEVLKSKGRQSIHFERKTLKKDTLFIILYNRLIKRGMIIE